MSDAEIDFSSTRVNLGLELASVFAERESERYSLHLRYLNEMMVHVLRIVGYDVGFRSGKGQYLFDSASVRYLDLLSGWGVFGIGRNHPRVREALASILACDLPNLVQMDVSPLAGILAEKLLRYAPFQVCFVNSGTEAAESAGQKTLQR
jgi:ornithine--oxo-acid transaminase